jgi:DNA-binding NarL/FixJ family response regulator
VPASNCRLMKPAKIRILLVEDHALLRRGLASLIETEPDLMVCAEASSHEDGLEAIATAKPDLVITDLSLKDSDGLQLIKDIRKRFRGLPILALSTHDEALYAERALRAGARGYVMKQELAITVLIAIRRVVAGDIYTSEAMSRRFSALFIGGAKLGKRTGLDLLSDREFEVYKLIGQGKSTRAIADVLHVSVKTIESHKERLKDKLRLSSGAELVRRATVWVETGMTD